MTRPEAPGSVVARIEGATLLERRAEDLEVSGHDRLQHLPDMSGVRNPLTLDLEIRAEPAGRWQRAHDRGAANSGDGVDARDQIVEESRPLLHRVVGRDRQWHAHGQQSRLTETPGPRAPAARSSAPSAPRRSAAPARAPPARRRARRARRRRPGLCPAAHRSRSRRSGAAARSSPASAAAAKGKVPNSTPVAHAIAVVHRSTVPLTPNSCARGSSNSVIVATARTPT